MLEQNGGLLNKSAILLDLMKSSEVRIGGDRSNCSVCFQCGTNDSDCTKETKHGDEACRCIIFFLNQNIVVGKCIR